MSEPTFAGLLEEWRKLESAYLQAKPGFIAPMHERETQVKGATFGQCADELEALQKRVEHELLDRLLFSSGQSGTIDVQSVIRCVTAILGEKGKP